MLFRSYEQAVESFDRAASLDPENAEILYNRAVALAAGNRTEEALAAFQDALKIDPENRYALEGFNITSARIDMGSTKR